MKVGIHKQVKVVKEKRKPVEGRFMVGCEICGTTTHSFDQKRAIDTLKKNESCHPCPK